MYTDILWWVETFMKLRQFVSFVFLIVRGLRHLAQHSLYIFTLFVLAAEIFARARGHVRVSNISPWKFNLIHWAISKLVLACFGAVLHGVASVPHMINENQSL